MAEFQPAAISTESSEFLSGALVGRFRIGERLGKGGMGEVYLAQDTKLKRQVALKRLAPQLRADAGYRRRFLEEAERASRFSDAHVAALYDVLEERGEIFLVMEYVEGENLRQRLRRPISLQEFFDIANQCVEALAAAHERGIVHCDIKPENIMLTAAGQVKILDFGVAKHLPRSDQSSTVDRSGSMAGTPAYMSPEVLLERAPDGRADVFSLGVVFYEALTGHHPFLASSFVATSDRIRKETPAAIRIFNSKVPEGLEALVFKAMAKDPAQRYASASALLEDLHLLEAGLLPRAERLFWQGKKIRDVKRISIVACLVAALIVGVALFERTQIGAWLNPRQSASPIHLAVLPFTATGNEAGTKAFSDGLTEILAAKLTQLSGRYPLEIVPASEVRAESVTTVEQARKGFGVSLVLEGSLQESGGRVRVTYGLVDAKTMRQLHADAITAESDDVFAVQDKVVENVVTMLGLQLEGNEHAVLLSHGTQEPAAYDFYLRGRGYLQDYHKSENVTSAIALFTHALQRDPKYALAYAGLGEAYWAKYDATYDPEWLSKSMTACQHSVALDTNLASGYTCLGTVYTTRGRYEEAVEQFQRAVQLDSTSEDAYRGLASAYEKLGKLGEAEKTYQLAIQMRPQYWAGYQWLGSFYGHQARYADAARQLNQAIALAPDDPHGYRNLGGVYILMGDYKKAIESLRKAIDLSPTSEAYSNIGIAFFDLRRFEEAVAANEHACTPESHDYIACGNLARAYYWSPGRRAQARPVYERAIRMAEEAVSINPRDGDPHILMANYSAMLGDRPQALKQLKQALDLSHEDPECLLTGALVYNQFGDKNAALGWLEKAAARGYSLAEIRAAPEFDNLRDQYRFQQLLRPR
jgi:tetratricopeptide (TPR) repeat protein/TolB-like protein/predicted Ser/Thr protein kinase